MILQQMLHFSPITMFRRNPWAKSLFYIFTILFESFCIKFILRFNRCTNSKLYHKWIILPPRKVRRTPMEDPYGTSSGALPNMTFRNSVLSEYPESIYRFSHGDAFGTAKRLPCPQAGGREWQNGVNWKCRFIGAPGY